MKYYYVSQILDGTDVIVKGSFLEGKVRIFFPNVTITEVSEITSIYCKHDIPESWQHKTGSDDCHWTSATGHILLSDTPGWVIAHGFVGANVDFNSESYFALVHDEDLFSRKKKEIDAFMKKEDDKMLKEAGFKSWDEFHAWEREDQARELEEKLKPIKT